MKKIRKILIINIILFWVIVVLINTKTEAVSIDYALGNFEYSESFKRYLELPEEERKKVLMPRIFDIPVTHYDAKNPFNRVKLASIAENKFSLKSLIPNNLDIRNQKQTGRCWAFATLSSLETNLAMINGDTTKYDFSEMHMDYYTSKTFLNNEINEHGFNREVGSGGSSFISIPYLTNGSGAIDEIDLPFENHEDPIELSRIKNKKVTSQVYDTKEWPTYTKEQGNTEEVKNSIKSFVKTYGTVYVGIHGAQRNSDYCNNDTGALYCDNATICPVDHAVSIIGWDDDYAVSNFNPKHVPTSPGAWIIRNSWGEKEEYTYEEFKQMLWEVSDIREALISNNITEANQIPDSIMENIATQLGYNVENGKVYQSVGDHGLYYISYEDINIYSSMLGIEKSANKIDYDKIYQRNFYGYSSCVPLNISKAYIGEIFNRDTEDTEYLNQVSLDVLETCTCKVYVNPNGASLSKDNLQPVALKAGESETFDAGYHTLEFANPVELKENSFAVVIEIQGTNENSVMISLESKLKNPVGQGLFFDNVTLDKGKSFFTIPQSFETNEWIDCSEITHINENLTDGDLTIKAFVTKKTTPNEKILNSISVTTPPKKTNYTEGENFDKTGMVVTAHYSDNEDVAVTDYEITNGTSLKEGQTSVTISYKEKTTSQAITVNKKADDKEDPATPTPPDTKEEAVNSKIDNARANIISEKKYTYTNGKKEYVVIDTTITGIEKNLSNDQLEYYYYISTDANENSIKDWVKITDKQENNDKLQFTINSKDVANYSVLAREEKVYIYIKEVAIKGESSKTAITKALAFENDSSTIVKTYIDDVEKTTNDGTGNDDTGKDEQQKPKDNTEAPKILPYTGKKVIVLCIISFLIISGIFMYARYKNMSKYIK